VEDAKPTQVLYAEGERDADSMGVTKSNFAPSAFA